MTAVIALPHDDKSRTLLLGRYLGRDEPCQIEEPSAVMNELIATVVRVRGYVIAVALFTRVINFLISILHNPRF